MGIEHTANEKSALPGIRGFLMMRSLLQPPPFGKRRTASHKSKGAGFRCLLNQRLGFICAFFRECLLAKIESGLARSSKPGFFVALARSAVQLFARQAPEEKRRYWAWPSAPAAQLLQHALVRITVARLREIEPEGRVWVRRAKCTRPRSP